ncbi:MAG: SUMF1/EgtB/PvdO family nonheme iron enzyme [Ardenticatenia bacterium]|nr:SUMF1/EgtB/PvdO family nonheme iron enzyme [Ardenticatenia bacterium]
MDMDDWRVLQQRCLSIMLDPLEPVTERADAGRRLAAVGDPRPGVGLRADGLPDLVWCDVPAGSVDIGPGIGCKEVAAFQIAMYPVTQLQYQAFLDAGDGYQQAAWWDLPAALAHGEAQAGGTDPVYANHPAVVVSWHAAMAFCRWLSAKMSDEFPRGTAIRLPTEAEWVRAAGGVHANAYPWGSEHEVGRANVDERGLPGGSWLESATAVGVYPAGMADCGALDLLGNVWEWTLGEYVSVGSTANRWPRVLSAGSYKVALGGSWLDAPCSCADWLANHPLSRQVHMGFRVVLADP